MSPQSHRSITVTSDTWRLIEEMRKSFPLQVSQGEVVRGALLVLFDQDDPLEAITRAKRRLEEADSSSQE